MELYLYTNKTKNVTNITNFVTTATLHGEYRSCCRSLEFALIQNYNDKNITTVSIKLGDIVRLIQNNVTLFWGVVWDRDKLTNSNTVNISCNDYGIYLKNNNYSYNFKNITADSITRKICSDFGIAVGNIASTGVKLNRKFINSSLYDMIMTSYSLSNDKKYYCLFEMNKLNIYEKGAICTKTIQTESNLLTSSSSESLEGVVNRVNIFNNDDKLIKKVDNNNLINLYGVLSDYIKLSKDEKLNMNDVNKKLQDVQKKISITNFGDVGFITGKGVIVKEPQTGLNGLFWIDEDKHIWENGIYQNMLTLNLKNIMDEKDSGIDEQTNKSKRVKKISKDSFAKELANLDKTYKTIGGK